MKSFSDVRPWILIPLVILGLSGCAHDTKRVPGATTTAPSAREVPVSQDPIVPAKVATTVFFKINDLPSDDQVPLTSIGSLVGPKPQVALSVLIAELAKAEGLDVKLGLDIPDRVITMANLDRNTPAITVLKSIGQQDDFYVSLNQKNLSFYKKHVTTVRVPPVGIVNDKKVTLANYDFWKTLLQKQGATLLEIKPSGVIRFEASPQTLNRLRELMKNYAERGEIIDLQMAYISLSKPMATILPAVANLTATNLEPGRTVQILSTSGSPDALMKALGRAVLEKDSYHALLFLGDVGTSHSICDRGLRIAAKRQGKTLMYDLTFIDTATEACIPVGPSVQTEGTLGDTLTLNLSTNNAFVMYPERITFKQEGGK